MHDLVGLKHLQWQAIALQTVHINFVFVIKSVESAAHLLEGVKRNIIVVKYTPWPCMYVGNISIHRSLYGVQSGVYMHLCECMYFVLLIWPIYCSTSPQCGRDWPVVCSTCTAVLAGCSEVCMFESGDSKDKMASTPSEPEQVCAVLYLYIYAYVKICLVQFCTWRRPSWGWNIVLLQSTVLHVLLDITTDV